MTDTSNVVGPIVGPEIADFDGRIPAGHWHRLMNPITGEPTGQIRRVAMRDANDFTSEVLETYRDAIEAGKVTDCESWANLAQYDIGGRLEVGTPVVSVHEGGNEGHYVTLAWLAKHGSVYRTLASWKVLTGETDAEEIARWVRSTTA